MIDCIKIIQACLSLNLFTYISSYCFIKPKQLFKDSNYTELFQGMVDNCRNKIKEIINNNSEISKEIKEVIDFEKLESNDLNYYLYRLYSLYTKNKIKEIETKRNRELGIIEVKARTVNIINPNDKNNKDKNNKDSLPSTESDINEEENFQDVEDEDENEVFKDWGDDDDENESDETFKDN